MCFGMPKYSLISRAARLASCGLCLVLLLTVPTAGLADSTPTNLYVPDVSGTITDTVTISATLTTMADEPVAGAQVSFSVNGGAVGSGITDATGLATISYLIVSGSTGTVPIDAAFGGDAAYSASMGSGTLTRVQIDTKTYVPDRTGEVGGSVVLRGYLYRSDNSHVVGKALTFKVGVTVVGSAVTDSNGRAQFTYSPIASGSSSRTIRVDWAGDSGYRASYATGTLTVLKAAVYIVPMARTTVPGDFFRPRALVRRLSDYTPLSGKTITFRYDGTVLGTGVTAVDGIARVSYGMTTDWSPGLHTCRAEFAGDTSFAAGYGDTSFRVAEGISFATPNLYAVPSPQQMTTADFDHDGRLDIVVASLDGRIYILYGQGDGTFDAPRPYSIGMGGHCVVAVDLDRDGWMDVVECQEWDSRIAVIRNTGGRAFDAAVYYPVGPKAYGASSADFNGDGWPDLAVALNGSQQLAVMLNKGDGTFWNATYYNGGRYPGYAFCRDLNADGHSDIAVTSMEDDVVTLFRGDGRGHVAAVGSIKLGRYPGRVASADIDGDGQTDLVITNQWSDSINILYASRYRTFRLSPQYAAGSYPYTLFCADVDSDGRPDIVLSNGAAYLGTGTPYFSVMRNIGGGAVSKPFSFAAAGRDSMGIVVADFNGDGQPDVATSTEADNRVGISLNTTY